MSLTSNPEPHIMPVNPTIFRTYDIRGIVGEDLTSETVFLIGRALGSMLHEQNLSSIVIARDGRLSGPTLIQSLQEGLLKSGIDVIDIGMVPTPTLYFAAHFDRSQSGAMLTGSHNPPNYNGIKMMVGGRTLSGELIQSLYHRIEHHEFVDGNGTYQEKSLDDEYLGAITKDITLSRPLKIVVDCGNGVAGKLAPILYKALGAEVIECFCEVDGTFPNHHPDPSIPDNLKDVQNAIQKHSADVGLAFDGDGDRLGVVTNQGEIIWPDRLMMLFAKALLKEKPQSQIIFDVKCTRLLAEIIKEANGKPIMWKTGHSLIKEKIKETNAALAGEMSGHLFFNDRWYGYDDALYAGARLLELLANETNTLSELFQSLPDSVNTPELKIEVSEEEKFRLIENLQERGAFEDGEVVTLDGLRVEFKDGWGLIRASNTTPCLILRFEADNKTRLSEIQELFRKNLLAVNPELHLPF